MELNKIINKDCIEGLKELPDNCIDTCVTSPPYFGLRDYGHDNQIGLEETPELYVAKMVEVFTEVKRVLKKEGTLWLNLGDSYNGSGGSGSAEYSKKHTQFGKIIEGGTAQLPKMIKSLKPKDLIGIPWMVAFALRTSGWYLRQDIIWSKPNPMPESVTDRCTKAHEYIFLMSKSAKYYYDNEAIQEAAVWDLDGTGTEDRKQRSIEGMKSYPTVMKNGIRPRQFGAIIQEGTKRGDVGNVFVDNGKRNKRSVWTVTTKPYSDAHFATFPEDLIVDMIKAGCPEKGIVLDCFMGAGTTALVAAKLNRNYIGFELNADYLKIAKKRLEKHLGFFNPSY